MEAKDSVQMTWSDFQKATINFFGKAQRSGDFADVTLACEDGDLIPAHRVILSAGSSFFEAVFKKIGKSQSISPLLFLRGVEEEDLGHILTFLYTGEVNVLKAKLEQFLGVAKDLGVRGFNPEKQEQKEGVAGKTMEVAHKEEEVDEPQEKVDTNDPEDLEDLKFWSRPPRKTKAATSPVWNFATKLDKMRAQCNLCEKLVPAQEHIWNMTGTHFLFCCCKFLHGEGESLVTFKNFYCNLCKILSYSKYA